MKDILMKKILLLYMLVFVFVIFLISFVVFDEVEMFKCIIIVDVIIGNILYEIGECVCCVFLCLFFKFLLVIMGFDSGIL